MTKYWNKKLKCWWEPSEAMQVVNGKIYQQYRTGHWIDVTEYIEVRK